MPSNPGAPAKGAFLFGAWRLCRWAVAWALLATGLAGNGWGFEAKVVGVVDGDTVDLLRDGRDALRVRLYGIDAPERAQAGGRQAKQCLSGMIFGKTVKVRVRGTDRYGKAVAVLFLQGEDINRRMVREGQAWWYRYYAREEMSYAQAEREARDARRGLWAGSDPVPPWRFRRERR